MKTKKFLLSFSCLALGPLACSGTQLTFLANEKANISLVDFEDQSGEGDLLGETPIQVDLDKLKNQYIRVWGEEIYPQYWVVKPMKSGKNEVTLRLDRKDDSAEADATVKTQEMNRGFRMLLRAYKALTAKDWETAREVCKQMSQLQPEAAAPHIITGLSFLAEGNKGKARAAFVKAKNLDPEDRDLEELLRMSQP